MGGGVVMAICCRGRQTVEEGDGGVWCVEAFGGAVLGRRGRTRLQCVGKGSSAHKTNDDWTAVATAAQALRIGRLTINCRRDDEQREHGGRAGRRAAAQQRKGEIIGCYLGRAGLPAALGEPIARPPASGARCEHGCGPGPLPFGDAPDCVRTGRAAPGLSSLSILHGQPALQSRLSRPASAGCLATTPDRKPAAAPHLEPHPVPGLPK